MTRVHGFSLIGVLVSLLVLTLGILALLRFQHTLLLEEQNANDYAGATNLAQSALEQRKACAPSLCTSADFAPPSVQTTAPLTAYQCKLTSDSTTTTVSVRWHDAQGATRELAVASPRADCPAP